jgi:hypothetical protein
MTHKGKAIEVVATSGLFAEVVYLGDPEHKKFSVLTAELSEEAPKQPKAPRVPRAKRSGLGPKMEAVVTLMSDGRYRTLREISEAADYESLTGLSAGIRSLRKEENGGLTIEKRKGENSDEYEYALVGTVRQI